MQRLLVSRNSAGRCSWHPTTWGSVGARWSPHRVALFIVQGAPDLALTTVAVESLFTVLFVLVLRSLLDVGLPSSQGGGDLVLVVEGGRLVESGTFDALRRAGGTFQRLHEAQQLFADAGTGEKSA